MLRSYKSQDLKKQLRDYLEVCSDIWSRKTKNFFSVWLQEKEVHISTEYPKSVLIMFKSAYNQSKQLVVQLFLTLDLLQAIRTPIFSFNILNETFPGLSVEYGSYQV